MHAYILLVEDRYLACFAACTADPKTPARKVDQSLDIAIKRVPELPFAPNAEYLTLPPDVFSTEQRKAVIQYRSPLHGHFSLELPKFFLFIFLLTM